MNTFDNIVYTGGGLIQRGRCWFDVMCCADVLTTPIIHEYHAKDVFMGSADGNGLPKLSLSSNEEGLIRGRSKCNSSNTEDHMD